MINIFAVALLFAFTSTAMNASNHEYDSYLERRDGQAYQQFITAAQLVHLAQEELKIHKMLCKKKKKGTCVDCAQFHKALATHKKTLINSQEHVSIYFRQPDLEQAGLLPVQLPLLKQYVTYMISTHPQYAYPEPNEQTILAPNSPPLDYDYQNEGAMPPLALDQWQTEPTGWGELD